VGPSSDDQFAFVISSLAELFHWIQLMRFWMDKVSSEVEVLEEELDMDATLEASQDV